MSRSQATASVVRDEARSVSPRAKLLSDYHCGNVVLARTCGPSTSPSSRSSASLSLNPASASASPSAGPSASPSNGRRGDATAFVTDPRVPPPPPGSTPVGMHC